MPDDDAPRCPRWCAWLLGGLAVLTFLVAALLRCAAEAFEDLA